MHLEMKTLMLFSAISSVTESYRPEPFDFTILADYLTIVAGLFAIIGVVVTGVKYLTAPNNSPKIRDAKLHLREIVIYFGLYALLYAILRWVLMLCSN